MRVFVCLESSASRSSSRISGTSCGRRPVWVWTSMARSGRFSSGGSTCAAGNPNRRAALPARIARLPSSGILARAIAFSDDWIARSGEPVVALSVELARPRNRVDLAEDTRYVHYRKEVLDFLYTRHGHVEKAAA